MTTLIERHECASEAEWHALRAQDVTASQVGALFGVHEWTTPYQLWQDKAGRTSPQATTEAMHRGNDLEPVAVAKLRRMRPDWEITYSTEAMVYFRDPVARLGATPDVIVENTSRGRGNVQIKTMSAYDFATKWHDAEGTPEPPLWICLQSELERHLVGADWTAAAALVMGARGTLDLHLIEVPTVAGVIDSMRARSKSFWRSVDLGEEPEPDYSLDAQTIDDVYRKADPEDAIDLTQDASIDDLLRMREEWSATRRMADDEARRIETQIKHRLGTAEVAYLTGGRAISWRRERRAGRMIPPSDGRRLHLPKPLKENSHA